MKKSIKNKNNVQEIKEQIRSGDQKLISDILECTTDYVSMVFRGERKSERILNLAGELIENREAFILKHKSVK